MAKIRPYLWISTCVLSLLVGGYMGWRMGRWDAGLPGQIIKVSQAPVYEPVQVVPDSLDWPEGEPVEVATVGPPTKKERKELEQDFRLDLDADKILGKWGLPDLPDGGRAVVSVPEPKEGEPGKTKLTVRANPPPLIKVGWNPEVQGWIGYATEGRSWSGYVSVPRLICVRDRVCLTGRAGYESRPWGEGLVAEAGLSLSF